MKGILISIKPRFVAKILNGEKTIEIRKTKPNVDLPIDVYIYCTKSNYLGFIPKRYIGKVVAKFTLNKVEEIKPQVKLGLLNTYNTYETETLAINPLLEKCCLDYNELDFYLKWKTGYAWHISNLVIFDKPKELSEFDRCVLVEDLSHDNIIHIHQRFKITKAPQSFAYIEVGE